MPKITFIGAGSCIFTRALLGDILQFPELGDSEIALMDIDPDRLETAEILAQKIAKALDITPKIRSMQPRLAARFVLRQAQGGSGWLRMAQDAGLYYRRCSRTHAYSHSRVSS